MGGLEGPPKPPECSERPGAAVALLCLPKAAPTPPNVRKRPGAAVALLCLPKAAPTPPNVRKRPGAAVALLCLPKAAPTPPNVRKRPGAAVALLCLPKGPTPGKDCRSQESFFLSCQRPGAGRYSHTDDSRPCPHAASPCSSSVTMTHTWGDAPG